jgi:DNA-binding CsgD family transcriptional regulator
MSTIQAYAQSLSEEASELGLKWIDFTVSSNSHEELCQRLVHDRMFQGQILGARFFRVGSDLNLTGEIGHGATIELAANQVLQVNVDEAIKARTPKKSVEYEKKWLVIPLFKGSLPLAVLVLSLDESLDLDERILGAASIAARVGYFFYCFIPVRSILATAPMGLPSSFRLSDRHLSIIQLMSEGLSNREIGKVLLISESTVRQENIKIFKYLGVQNRKDAVKQALNIEELRGV